MKKFLLFISPVYWQEPNKQTQYTAEVLSKKYIVFFLDTFRYKKISFQVFFSNQIKREGYLNQYFAKKNIFKNPIIFVFFNYEQGEKLRLLDQVAFLVQLFLLSFFQTGKFQFVIWANICYFENCLKFLFFLPWFFDFYDRHFDFAIKKNNDFMRTNERWLIKHAKKIFISSNFYLNLLPTLIDHLDENKIVQVPIGYNIDHLLPKTYKKKKKIVVGYVGGLSARLDYFLIEQIVKNNLDITFVFSGPQYQDHLWISPKRKEDPLLFLKRLESYSNVSILKSTNSKEQQAQLMTTFTIGWIPYDMKVPFNYYCMPTKYMEYLAVGLPVFSTQLPSLLDKNNVHFFSSPNEFKIKLDRVFLQENNETIKARKSFAQANDLTQKAKFILHA